MILKESKGMSGLMVKVLHFSFLATLHNDLFTSKHRCGLKGVCNEWFKQNIPDVIKYTKRR